MRNKAPWTRLLAVLAALLLLAAACGSSSDSTTESSDGTEAATSDTDDQAPLDEESGDETQDADEEMTEDEASSEDEEMTEDEDMAEDDEAPEEEAADEMVVGEILESFVGTPLTQSPGAVVPVDDEVKAYFNNGSNGTLIAIYHGPGLSDPTDLCPGNSLQTASGFEFISNAPASPGACDGFPTDVGSVRVCTGNVWLYQTMIPNDSSGTLWASLEATVDGTIANMGGQAANTPGTPEIDYSADKYTISTMFTSDGSTEITCEAPLT